MKKLILSLTVITVLLSNSGCGTIFGGKISACQKQKPAAGSPTRQLRVAALIGDFFIGGVISLAVDFADGGIYKPCADSPKK